MTRRPDEADADEASSAWSLLSDDDIYWFNEGTHRRLGEKLGAHLGPGAASSFSVWAPNAVRGGVIGDFNDWNPDADVLERAATRASGRAWSATPRRDTSTSSPSHTRSGAVLEKADPFARCTENPPRTGSVVWDLAYEWGDGAWMQSRGDAHTRSARRSRSTRCTWVAGGAIPADPRRLLGYTEVAEPLIDHVRDGRVHPRRVPPAHGAPVLRLVGVPDHRVLRPDAPLRDAAGADVPDRPAPPGRDRRALRLGAVALSRGRRSPWPSSTARTSSSTPIPGSASTRTGRA